MIWLKYDKVDMIYRFSYLRLEEVILNLFVALVVSGGTTVLYKGFRKNVFDEYVVKPCLRGNILV